MLLNVSFLLLWRELPKLQVIARIQKFRTKLGVMIGCTLSLWLLFGSILLLIAQAVLRAGFPARGIGLLAVSIMLALATGTLWSRHVPAPVGKNRVTWFVYVSRGLLAGVAITCSGLIATYSSTAGGLAAAFPAIYLTTV